MNETPEITRESFYSLSPEKQFQLVHRALEWFCFIESVNPYFIYFQNETGTIKAVLEGYFISVPDKTDDRTGTGA